ncbi:MAG: type II toxin-antitoxin system Phd/YefM family antitoxin [Candidatus Andersenbacteria bacterium]|nr:type II toxin-antitoxin system Phd/YefM family antitoxin [Candidatus Andersenbacteria bacterium]
MDSKHTLSMTEARKRFFEIAKDVQRADTRYVFTDKGRPKAVLVSAEEYDSLIETLEVYRQFPNLDADIKQAEKEFREGKTIPLEEILAEQGLMLADKGKTTYVASRNRKKGAKRSR